MTTNPQRFRYRTAEVEAVQWTGDNADQLAAFCSPFDFQTIDPEDRGEDPDQTAAMRESAHGTWQGMAPGDWAVKIDGRFVVGPAADFAERYEPAAPAIVSPPPATPADILLSAAQHLYTALFPAVYDDMGQKAAEGVNRAVSELRRLAGEEQQQDDPEAPVKLPYIHIDDDGDQLDIGTVMASTYDGEAPVVYVAADQHQGDQVATVYVRPERVVEVIAALRAARQAAEALPAEAPR